MIELESYAERICILDNQRVHESSVYRTIAYEHGIKYANRFTRRVCVKTHPPPEVKTHVEDHRTTTHPMGVAG